jgi:serine/threonine-protein kinase HipA
MKIKQIVVTTPQGESGVLDKESRFVFNYGSGDRAREVSLTMPIRAESYASGALLTPFAMNKPEGWLYRQIVERMAKHEQVDDMRLLAIVGSNQIGRLSYTLPGESRTPTRAQIGLQALLKREPTKELFDFLVDVYFESGISGVQPKVLMPDADKLPDSKATVIQPDLIVKSGGGEFPHLTENEFLCMDAARRAGIAVPKFWLSDDGGLFVMERFDLGNDQRLGFEDMSVLMDKAPDPQGHYKYQGSYENIVRVIRAYCRGGEGLASSQRFFEYLALCVMVRNGDAHLKNFGLLYEHPAAAGSPTLAPLYDVVTTTVYAYRDYRSERTLVDRTLALKLNKEKRYPTRQQLLKFGADVCHVRDPQQVIERIATAMSETTAANSERIDREFLRQLTSEWDGGRLSVALKS